MLSLSPRPALAADLKLMTGPQGGVWVPLGGQLKDMWEKAVPGLNVQSLPGAGIANVRGVEEGKADVGFGNSISTVDGARRQGAVPQAARPTSATSRRSIRNIIQIVVPADAGINTVKDLKGKGDHHAAARQHRRADHRPAPEGQRPELQRRQGRASSSYTDSVDADEGRPRRRLRLGTTIPSGAVMDLAAARDIKLLDLSDQLDEMKKLNPGYTLVTVPKGTYPKQDKDVKVIGYATHIVASCKLPADDGLRDDQGDRRQHHVAGGGQQGRSPALTPKGMAEDIGVPFHPGAAKFYKEAGITVKTQLTAIERRRGASCRAGATFAPFRPPRRNAP